MADTSLDRRSFLAAAASAGSLLAACTGDDEAGGSAPESPDGPASTSPADSRTASPADGPVDFSDWDAVRAQFALDPSVAHFAAFVLAGHPASVRQSIARWREALDVDTEQALSNGAANEETARTRAARYLGVRADDIALTDSTTMGLGVTYQGLRLSPGDRVLTTTHDFYSTHESLRLAAARTGARVEKIALYDDPVKADADEIVSRLRTALRPRTRIVAVTWVHSSTGVKLPVRRIADMLAEHNAARPPAQRALLCVDAVHEFGAEDAGPEELGCDVFVTGTHKWLFGPRGTGLVWASKHATKMIDSVIPPFSAEGFTRWLNDEVVAGPFGTNSTPGGYHTFEHRWALGEAFDFHLEIGRSRVAARTRELATRLKEGLAELRNIEVVTPLDPELSAGIVCCEVSGKGPFEVVDILRKEHGISTSVTPYREPYLRLGPSIVTSPDEVDAAVTALGALR